MSEEFTGCLPRETKVGDGAFRIVGEDPDVPLVPQDEWKDVDDDEPGAAEFLRLSHDGRRDHARP